MLMGSIWELAIPALTAVGSTAIYVLVPELRRNVALRLILIAAVALTAIEIMIATLIFGVFFLSGGMANF